MKYEFNNSNNRKAVEVLNQSNAVTQKKKRTAVQHATARLREILNKKWKGKQCMGNILEV